MPNKIKSFFRSHPSIRIFLPFGLGILMGSMAFAFIELSISFLVLIWFLQGLILVIYARTFQTILLYLIVFFLGFLHAEEFEPSLEMDSQQSNQYIGTVLSSKKSNFTQLEVFVRYVKTGATYTPNSFKVILYVDDDKVEFFDQVPSKFEEGQWINLTTKLKRVSETRFPYAFNYGKFLHRKHIYYQGFASLSEIDIYETDHVSFRSILAKARNALKEVIAKYTKGKASRGIACALLIGDKSALDKETYSQFSNSGAVHVLAVSGLHVGILTQLLLFISSFLQNKWLRFRRLQFFFVLIGIWGFAFVTGCSPSVLRASLMFSLFLIAKDFYLVGSNFNLLFASALILLCINPNQLFQLGFQFSYLAVFGILLLYRPLEKLLTIKNKLGGYFWQLTCVSIAAQLWVAPLSIFYFNQFPLQFILSGWVAIPLTSLCLSIGVSLFVLELLCPSLNVFVGFGFELTLSLFSKSIFHLDKIPNALLKELWIDPIQVLWFYLVLLFLGIFLHHKKRIWIYATAFVLLLSGASSVYKKAVPLNYLAFHFYPTKFGSAFDLNYKNKLIQFRSEKFDEKTVNFLNTRFYLSLGNQEKLICSRKHQISSEDLNFSNGVFQLFGEKSLLWVTKDWKLNTEKPQFVDYVFVESLPKNEALITTIHSSHWVFTKEKDLQKAKKHIPFAEGQKMHALDQKAYHHIKLYHGTHQN